MERRLSSAAAQRAFLKDLHNSSIPISFAESPTAELDYPRTLFWNHAVVHTPLAIIEPRSTEDVQLAIRLANKYDINVGVVNAGGHDNKGRAIAPGMLCIDLSKHFRRVAFDQNAMEVRVGGGCNFGDVLEHLPEGFEISSGTIKGVGILGWTTGGGYGFITHVVGMGSDRLLGAKVVMHDGTIVECSDTKHQDLLWCLRGGGAGFGVVLEMTIKVDKLPKMLHAVITWPLTDRAAVHEAMKTYQDLLEGYPDQLSVLGRMSTIPNVGPVFGLAPTFHGPQDLAQKVIDQLAAIGKPKVLKSEWICYKDMMDPMAEKAAPRGGHYHASTQCFSRISPAAVDILIDANLADPHGKLIIHDMHGAPCRRSIQDSAFPLREPHFQLFIVGSCGLWGEKVTPEITRQAMQWAEDVAERLSKVEGKLPGGYVSLLHPGEERRVKEWFGPNFEKLQTLRERFDPNNRFRGAIGYIPRKGD